MKKLGVALFPHSRLWRSLRQRTLPEIGRSRPRSMTAALLVAGLIVHSSNKGNN